jgi:ABC-type sugar transport system ATPase subunit
VTGATGVVPNREAPPALEVKSISKRFGAVRAVRDVSFAIQAGSVLGLIGDNGAGKSTIVNMVAGVFPPDEGQILVDGVECTNQTPAEARARGIETVYQSLNLILPLNIAENVYLHRELRLPDIRGRVLGWVDKDRMRNEVAAGLSRLDLHLPNPRTKVATLSGGDRQLVAIARPVLWGSRVVVLDEPFASLGVHETDVVVSFVDRLREHGVGVMVVSHNMEHVLRVTDRIVALRLGEKVLDTKTSDTSGEELIEVLTGESVASPAEGPRTAVGAATDVNKN